MPSREEERNIFKIHHLKGGDARKLKAIFFI